MARQAMSRPMHRPTARAVARFERPMVPAEFAYSPLGALAAIAVASLFASLLYAFTQWPLETLAWLAGAAFMRYVGRGPIAELFR